MYVLKIIFLRKKYHFRLRHPYLKTLNYMNMYFLNSMLPPKFHKKTPESPESPLSHMRVFTS